MPNHPNRNWRVKCQEVLPLFREERGLMQKDAAVIFGVSHSTWNFWENATHKPPTMLWEALQQVPRDVKNSGINPPTIPYDHQDYLRRWRKIHDMTQTEAGARVGVGKMAWAAWERASDFPSAKKPPAMLFLLLEII